jgi:hypothetical protein
MIIREATAADVIELAHMLMATIAKTLRSGETVKWDIPIDGTSMALALNILITNPQKNSVVFIAVDEAEGIVGAIGGHIEPYVFNRQYLMAYENMRQAIVGAKVTWKLIAAFEEWAKAQGANAVVLGERTAYTDKSLVPYMERLGYNLGERMYLKEVI